jgi:hypothetical protein
MFWGAWKWTGDKKYITPILESGSAMAVNANVLDILDLRKDWAASNAPAEGGRRNPNTVVRPGDRAASLRGSSGEHFAWQIDGDKSHLERLYAQQIESCAINEYIETEGSLWIDRVGAPTTELQRARLGGVALIRNYLYPGHEVSWKFAAPADDQSVAILVPDATPTAFKVITYNLETSPVRATMTGWNIDPGVWEITQGVDTNNDDVADQSLATREERFERASSLEFTLPPRASTVFTLKLKTPGTPYWSRPDLGFTREDVILSTSADALFVKVHSVGAVACPATTIAVRNSDGKIIATASVPALEAPIDLVPKTADVTIKLPSGANLSGATVELDPDDTLGEITRMNNTVKF